MIEVTDKDVSCRVNLARDMMRYLWKAKLRSDAIDDRRHTYRNVRRENNRRIDCQIHEKLH